MVFVSVSSRSPDRKCAVQAGVLGEQTERFYPEVKSSTILVREV